MAEAGAGIDLPYKRHMDVLERVLQCRIDTIAPHIHVLYRDIPFILNISAPTA